MNGCTPSLLDFYGLRTPPNAFNDMT